MCSRSVSSDYDLNYAALAVSIINKTSVEKSFMSLNSSVITITVTEDDVIEMNKMKIGGSTYAQIAKEFNMAPSSIHRIIKKYRKDRCFV